MKIVICLVVLAIMNKFAAFKIQEDAPAFTCSDGIITNNWRKYLSSWSTSIAKGNTKENKQNCWALVQQNVPEAFGMYFDYHNGYCRGMISWDGLPATTLQATYPDNQGERSLCIPKGT